MRFDYIPHKTQNTEITCRTLLTPTSSKKMTKHLKRIIKINNYYYIT